MGATTIKFAKYYIQIAIGKSTINPAVAYPLISVRSYLDYRVIATKA
jgi:hypothetical protein